VCSSSVLHMPSGRQLQLVVMSPCRNMLVDRCPAARFPGIHHSDGSCKAGRCHRQASGRALQVRSMVVHLHSIIASYQCSSMHTGCITTPCTQPPPRVQCTSNMLYRWKWQHDVVACHSIRCNIWQHVAGSTWQHFAAHGRQHMAVSAWQQRAAHGRTRFVGGRA
jgi:hypothetical protein